MYQRLVKELDGHRWAFKKNRNQEIQVMTIENDWAQVQTNQKDGKTRVNIYWKDGKEEEYYV